MRLSAFDIDAANALLQDLKAPAEGFVRAGTTGTILTETTAFMRYAGQGWEIPVELPARPFTADDAAALKARFRENYARFFGRAIDGLDGLDIEIVTWSVKAENARPKPEQRQITLGKAKAGTMRKVFDPSQATFLDTVIVDRAELAAGARLAGPAIIVERETSTVVTSPFDAVMQDDGSLLILRKEIAA
jgi:N-methylhydantoinase A